jgi:competence protein ComEC
MGLVALAALSSGRRGGGIPALAAAVMALLLIDPWLARSYGFALSVLATAGLLVFAGRWARGLNSRGFPLPLAHAIAVPAAAHMACAPLVTMLSEQVSLVAVPANLLVAPAIAPATVLGLLATLAGPVNPAAAEGLGWAAGLPAWWVVSVAERSAGLPMASMAWSGSHLGVALLTALLAAAVLLGRRAARHPALLALSLVFVLGMGLMTAARPRWPPEGWLVIACDVGQGDALVLSAGTAGAVVVDAGPDPRLVDRCLRDIGVERVAALLVTHLHADHVAGLPGVLRGREVGEVQLGDLYDEPAAELARVKEWTKQARVPIRRVRIGEHYTLGGLSWQVLWPARVIEREGSAPNNASVVVLAQHRSVRMLLTGDVEPAAQRAIAARWRLEAVDVLKVAHHGSAAQAPELLTLSRPRVAVISVGEGNDYGHPAPSTLRELARSGAVVGRTDLDGAVAVVGPVDRLRLVVARR